RPRVRYYHNQKAREAFCHRWPPRATEISASAPAAHGNALVAAMTTRTRWEWCLFRVSTADGPRHRYGSSWRSWAIHYVSRGRFVVTHLPTGRRLTEFDRLAIARRFCERIDDLADWNFASPPTDPALGLQLHRIALDVTGAKPALS